MPASRSSSTWRYGESAESEGKVAFVMLDIDYFKKVNDDFGHLAGDEALRGIARILEDSVRGGDIAGRYGGEEFSVILDARDDEEVQTFCERIRRSVEESVFVSKGRARARHRQPRLDPHGRRRLWPL